jgi:hypothetical protein
VAVLLDLFDTLWSRNPQNLLMRWLVDGLRKSYLDFTLSNAKNPSRFKTKDEEGFFAPLGGLRVAVFHFFPQREAARPVRRDLSAAIRALAERQGVAGRVALPRLLFSAGFEWAPGFVERQCHACTRSNGHIRCQS